MYLHRAATPGWNRQTRPWFQTTLCQLTYLSLQETPFFTSAEMEESKWLSKSVSCHGQLWNHVFFGALAFSHFLIPLFSQVFCRTLPQTLAPVCHCVQKGYSGLGLARRDRGKEGKEGGRQAVGNQSPSTTAFLGNEPSAKTVGLKGSSLLVWLGAHSVWYGPFIQAECVNDRHVHWRGWHTSWLGRAVTW